jgi:hypothetical protein
MFDLTRRRVAAACQIKKQENIESVYSLTLVNALGTPFGLLGKASLGVSAMIWPSF